jgi:hypothetical protein
MIEPLNWHEAVKACVTAVLQRMVQRLAPPLFLIQTRLADCRWCMG